MNILVTGGAGFIGSALIRHLINNTSYNVINVDKLTYAADLTSLESVKNSERYVFIKADICDSKKMVKIFKCHNPCFVIHLAAESHVDRSITSPAEFIDTNIFGTFTLLETSREYWLNLNEADKARFRFLHVSTDEVFGDLESDEALFTEKSNYNPSSPYSATKAASDHLVRAWGRTFSLPVIVSNCSNNYGPHQCTEKLIPLIIERALSGQPLPIYGNGVQVRDWLYVDDHARALIKILEKSKIGNSYNIGGHNEVRNIDVVHAICRLLDELRPLENRKIKKYEELVSYVPDRPGHDIRYAIDASKIYKDLGWKPQETFNSGLEKTVQWYLENSQV